MDGFITLALSLLFLPMVGAAALCFAGALLQVATAPSTPRWQQYLYFLVTGVILAEVAGLRWS